MGAMVAAGNNTQSSSDSVQDNGTRFKRKFRPAEPRNPGHSDMTVPSYELFPEDIPGVNIEPDVGQAPADGPGEGLSLEKSHDIKWGDVMEAPLEELALHSLDALYKSAIKRIASCGYTEEVATYAVLRSSHCNGCKDVESNIADNALAFLKIGLGVDSSVRENLSEALRELEKKVLENMVAMLKEVRPSFSTGDAMWCLLICDMNLPHACEIDVDILNGLQDGDVLLDATSSKPEPSTTLSTPPIASEINVLGLEKSMDLLQSPSSQTVMAAAAGTLVSHPGVVASSSNINVEDSYADPGQEHPMSSKEYLVAEFSYDVSRSAMRKEKPVNSRKGLADGSKREYMLQQTTTHLEKNYRGNGPNPYLRTVHKLSELGGMMSDKKFKLISKSSTMNSKNSSPQASIKVGMDTAGGDLTNNISFTARSFSKSYLPRSARTHSTLTFSEKCSASALHRANTEALLSLTSNSSTRATPKPNCSFETPSSECSEYSIQFDKIWGQLIPEEKKDETLSKLESRVQELQSQLNGWTEWTQKRVMQAAHRLSKDKAELHTLRQENEEVSRLYQEKLALEENTIKNLTEMENALSKASDQVVNANNNVRRLGIENSELKKTLQDAMALAEKSASTYQESSLKEMDILKKFQSEDRMKAVRHEEFATEKGKVLHLEDQLEQAKKYLGQLEVGRSQAEKVKVEALARAETDRKLQAEYRLSSKVKVDAITANAENGLQKYRDDIRRLTYEIAELKMGDSLKMAALRLDQEESGSWDLNRDCECVMCLTEERSVLFLPCAHLVVCTACNQMHEEKGMQDCPSCRTTIQERICVRSVDS